MPAPDPLVAKVEGLQNLLVSHATGGSRREYGDYEQLRRDLLGNPLTGTGLPRFVHTCRDLSQFWQFIKYKHRTYADRREYICDEFRPLIEILETRTKTPIQPSDEQVLSRLSPESVQTVWQRALDRRISDPEGAITAARALLETVCKHILDDLFVCYEDTADLPKLYRLASESLSIAPSQHTAQVFKQILGGCTSVVEGLASLRNRLGDAHGGGRARVRPAPRHAQLAVNLAGSMTSFLVATWEARKNSVIWFRRSFQRTTARVLNGDAGLHGGATIYRARLCFEVESSYSLTGLEAPLQVETPGVEGAWALKEVAPSSLLTGQRLDFRSPTVPSEESAERLGGRARSALMSVALRRGFGVMLTERLPGGQLFEAGRRLLSGDRYDELRDDVLGITVYQDKGRVGFVGIPPAQLRVSSPAAPLLREWSSGLADAVPVSDAVSTSFDLWSSSRSEGSSRARLLLLVMAVEALVDQLPRPEREREFVDSLLTELYKTSLPEDAKVRLRNGLSLLKRESVGASCQAEVSSQLGEVAGQTFRTCYRLRNVIAHGGKAPDARRLVHEANALEPIVKTLLLAKLGGEAA